MSRPLTFVILILAASLTAVAWLAQNSSGKNGQSLDVFCTASLKQPVEEIAAGFEKESGIAVHLQFGGTGTLLGLLRLRSSGDIFITADEASLDEARKAHLVLQATPLVKQRPVIAVRRGNPKSVSSLEDLARSDVRLGLANPESAAIGRCVKTALGDRYAALVAMAIVLKPTVTELAQDLSLGALDAAILWDSTVLQYPDLKAVEVPEFSSLSENASAAILTTSHHVEWARKFSVYLADPEKGGAVFAKHGFHALAAEQSNLGNLSEP